MPAAPMHTPRPAGLRLFISRNNIADPPPADALMSF